MGDVIHPGDVRFGEIEYSSNIKLCKSLAVKKFPTVLIYRGGDDGEQISEIFCKNNAMEDIVSQLDQLILASEIVK